LWLKLNDGSGSTAVDSSANGNNVTLTASPTWGTGSLAFDGSSQSGVGAATGVNFQDNNSWSIAAWIKTTATTSAAIMGTWTFDTPGGSGVRLCVSDASAGILSLLIANTIEDAPHSIYRLAHGSTTCNDGNLHFIVATYDGSAAASGIKFYLDGVSDTTHVDNDTAPGTLANANFFLARIGGSVPQFFPGTLNEVGVYSRVLSPTEISTLNTLGPR
jgi:hypothetical protein